MHLIVVKWNVQIHTRFQGGTLWVLPPGKVPCSPLPHRIEPMGYCSERSVMSEVRSKKKKTFQLSTCSVLGFLFIGSQLPCHEFTPTEGSTWPRANDQHEMTRHEMTTWLVPKTSMKWPRRQWFTQPQASLWKPIEAYSNLAYISTAISRETPAQNHLTKPLLDSGSTETVWGNTCLLIWKSLSHIQTEPSTSQCGQSGGRGSLSEWTSWLRGAVG